MVKNKRIEVQKMNKRQLLKSFLFPLILASTISLACGTVQFGVVTPTSDFVVTSEVETQGPELESVDSVEDPLPTAEITPTEQPDEDFSDLWIEYWDPKYGYGLALPAHWVVHPSNIQYQNSVMTADSYEVEFFFQNAIRGHWIDGGPPDGAIQLEFAGFEGINPDQATDVALNQVLTERGGTLILSIEETSIGEKDMYIVTQADKDGPDANTWDSYAFRPQLEVIILVQANPYEAIYAQDVQLVLESISYSKSEPIIKPTTSPFPPFELTNEVGVYPTATSVVAWRGHIASLPDGSQFDDKVVFYPEGAGEYGIKGWTPEVEAEIVSLRDATGDQQWVYLWGHLLCNYADYNKCRLSVDRMEYEGNYSGETILADGWVGTIKSPPDDSGIVFELSEPVPVWYHLSAGGDEEIHYQLNDLSDSNTQVKIWGEMVLGTPDLDEPLLLVSKLDPPSPRALPSSSACESGYPGSVAQVVEVIKYNLEIGNYYPFSYMIGNPFAIGYWQSEGVSLPRGEAYDLLVNELLPSPENVVVISDPNQFPDLMGMPISEMWGPEVDVAANLYIKGWGPDGAGEAIAVIARCTEGEQSAFFWYGILYAGGGF
jgi:hypothetical protein